MSNRQDNEAATGAAFAALLFVVFFVISAFVMAWEAIKVARRLKFDEILAAGCVGILGYVVANVAWVWLVTNIIQPVQDFQPLFVNLTYFAELLGFSGGFYLYGTYAEKNRLLKEAKANRIEYFDIPADYDGSIEDYESAKSKPKQSFQSPRGSVADAFDVPPQRRNSIGS